MLSAMNTSFFPRCLSIAAGLLTLLSLICSTSFSADAPAVDTTTRKPFGKYKNLFLERKGDQFRVVIQAEICLREGQLEGLLCRKGTKEHEEILTADVDARAVHFALLAAGAKEGSPVKFEPKYQPASGTPIKITLEYQKDGKPVSVPAKDWIINPKTKKHLETDWVFAGSKLVANPDGKDKPPIYLANYGDLICLCNMESAMLDLPVESPKRLEDRLYEAHTERIPPLETKVMVILEPVLKKEK
jgi:hypothetical protein